MIYGPSCFQFSDLLVAKGDADVRDQHNPTSKYLKFSFFLSLNVNTEKMRNCHENCLPPRTTYSRYLVQHRQGIFNSALNVDYLLTLLYVFFAYFLDLELIQILLSLQRQ